MRSRSEKIEGGGCQPVGEMFGVCGLGTGGVGVVGTDGNGPEPGFVGCDISGGSKCRPYSRSLRADEDSITHADDRPGIDHGALPPEPLSGPGMSPARCISRIVVKT